MTDLTNPEVQPNPVIGKLTDLSHELLRLQLDNLDHAWAYGEAGRCVLAAIGELMKLKNRISEAEGQD